VLAQAELAKALLAQKVDNLVCARYWEFWAGDKIDDYEEICKKSILRLVKERNDKLSKSNNCECLITKKRLEELGIRSFDMN